MYQNIVIAVGTVMVLLTGLFAGYVHMAVGMFVGTLYMGVKKFVLDKGYSLEIKV